MRCFLRASLVVLFVGTSGGRDAALAQVGTAFTYQGRLMDGAAPANGSYDLQLTLWDAATGGFLVGGTTLTSVAVASGLFTAVVDFGPGMFTGFPRWLEISVAPAGTGAFTTLAPRQELTPVANAIFAAYASNAGTVSGLYCADGQVAKWSGTAWNCGTDVDTDTNSGGTVTSVETGAGLTGGPVTGAGILSIAMGGVDSSKLAAAAVTNNKLADGAVTLNKIADGAIGSSKIAPGAVGSNQIDPAAVQARVSATCPAGTSMQTINSDGTVVCEADDDTNSGGTVTSVTAGTGLTGGTIVSSGTVSVATGGITSSMIANGAVGLSQIDQAAVQARVSATCPAGTSIQTINSDGTVVCLADNPQSGFSLATPDSTGDVGYYTSVTIGADGLGLISYFDNTNFDLKVAHCSNTACSSATTATLDSTGDVGEHTSVTIGADGLGLISYYDITNGDLRVAHCSNMACSSATTATLDSAGDVGEHTSVTIGADGLGLISYRDLTNSDLKVAHCSDTACSSATTATLDSTGDVGRFTSMTIGADGLGLVSYHDGLPNYDLKVAHCSNTACSSATTAILDSTGFVGYSTSVTIGADGLGLISYFDNNNQDLKVAHCSNTACSSATTATLDSTGLVGQFTSVTIGADGLGLISYYDDSPNYDLKVAHCSNTACSSATTAILDSTDVVGYFTSVTIGADGLGLISYVDVTNGNLKVAHCSNGLCSPFVVRRR